jgi:hypothetical protein
VAVVVVGDIPGELKAGEKNRFDPGTLDEAGRRRIRRVRVQYGPRFFVVPVNGRVQRKGGQLYRAFAFHDGPVEMAEQEAAGRDFRPKETLRIHQE